MYAVIETGGKQYKVGTGEFLQVEKLSGKVGDSIGFDQVLLVSEPSQKEGQASEAWIGQPKLSGAKVTAQIVGQGRGEKLQIVKFKRRKRYRRKTGHRQEYTQVLILGIDSGSGKKANLADADKKALLTKFHTHLKPKGPSSTPKKLGSRVRLKGGPEKVKAQKAAKRAAKKAPAQKGGKKAAKKVAKKKVAAKKAQGKSTGASKAKKTASKAKKTVSKKK